MKDDERIHKLLLIAGMEQKRRLKAKRQGSRIIFYQSRSESDKRFKTHHRYGRVHTLSYKKPPVPEQRRNGS